MALLPQLTSYRDFVELSHPQYRVIVRRLPNLNLHHREVPGFQIEGHAQGV